MTNNELARAMARLGLKQIELAKKLEIGERTMRRYVSGEAAIPRTFELAIFYLLEQATAA